MRIPPRATSRNRIWNPLKSFPTSRILEVSTRVKESELRKHTDDEEHPKRFLWILDLWQEVWSEAEGESYFGRLVEVGFQYMPN